MSNQQLSKKKILRAIELSAMDAEWLGMSERREALMLLREFARSAHSSEDHEAVVDQEGDERPLPSV